MKLSPGGIPLQDYELGAGYQVEDTHHWERPMAPSIQDVELKNMPWWWMVKGSEREFVAWRTSESVELTSMGGGLGM